MRIGEKLESGESHRMRIRTTFARNFTRFFSSIFSQFYCDPSSTFQVFKHHFTKALRIYTLQIANKIHNL